MAENNGEAYAKAVSEHIEDCNWARACELQHEYNLKNPENTWDPYWAFALFLLFSAWAENVTDPKTGKSIAKIVEEYKK